MKPMTPRRAVVSSRAEMELALQRSRGSVLLNIRRGNRALFVLL